MCVCYLCTTCAHFNLDYHFFCYTTHRHGREQRVKYKTTWVTLEKRKASKSCSCCYRCCEPVKSKIHIAVVVKHRGQQTKNRSNNNNSNNGRKKESVLRKLPHLQWHSQMLRNHWDVLGKIKWKHALCVCFDVKHWMTVVLFISCVEYYHEIVLSRARITCLLACLSAFISLYRITNITIHSNVRYMCVFLCFV